MANVLKDSVKRPGAHISYEEAKISRSSVTVSGGNYPASTVLGKVTATGVYKAVSAGASDGSQKADAILFAGVDASQADVSGVVNDCMTRCRREDVVWPDGATDAQIQGWINDLRENHVKID